MPFYEKKPFEAMIWNGSTSDLEKFFPEKQKVTTLTKQLMLNGETGELIFPLLNGMVHTIKIGDYIYKDKFGDLKTDSAEAFLAEYREV